MRGPGGCSPGSPHSVAPSQSSAQHAMQPLARVVRGGREFDEAPVQRLGRTVHGSRQRDRADLSRSEALIVSFIIVPEVRVCLSDGARIQHGRNQEDSTL